MTGSIVDQLNDPARISLSFLPLPFLPLRLSFRNRCRDAAQMRRLRRFGKSMHDDKIILENYPHANDEDDEMGIELGNS